MSPELIKITIALLLALLLVSQLFSRKTAKLDPLILFGHYYPVIFISIIVSVLIVVGVNLFLHPITFKDPQQQLQHAEQRQLPRLAYEAYAKLAKEHPLDSRYDYGLIRTAFALKGRNETEQKKLDDARKLLHQNYRQLLLSSNPADRDIANFGMGTWYYFDGHVNYALSSLLKVKNDSLPGFYLLLGKIALDQADTEGALANFRKEIDHHGILKETYENLSILLFEEGRQNQLEALLSRPKALRYVPLYISERVYFKDLRVFPYFKVLWISIFNQVEIWGFLGALLVMLVWVVYLIRIDIYQRNNWMPVILMLLSGALMVLPAYFFFDVNQSLFSLSLSGKPGNDFLFSVLVIGVVEEAMKILPFLLLLNFTKVIREPIDYIVYASLAALGFAFMENLLYFQQANLGAMHARALLSAVSHMFDSSIIAYGLILSRYRYKRHPVLFFGGFFLLAALAHGFYDFWLIRQVSTPYFLVSIIFWGSSLFIWSSMINNALNHSTYYKDSPSLDVDRLLSYLFVSMLSIFIFEFVVLSLLYGHSYGNHSLLNAFKLGGFLLVFLSLNLSNIQIIPNRWMPIRFFTATLPVDYDLPVGKMINLLPENKHSILADILPMQGIINERLTVSGEKNWYRVKLNASVEILSQSYSEIFVRPQWERQIIETNQKQVIFFIIPQSSEGSEKPALKRDDFRFVDYAVVA